MKRIEFFKNSIFMTLAASLSFACSSGGSGALGFLDTPSVGLSCKIGSFTPSISVVKVAGADTAASTFSVVTSDKTCKITFTLNGTAVTATNGTITLTGAQLQAGVNTLAAVSIGPTDGSTQTWQITKNQPPTCGTESPVPGSVPRVSIGANQTFQVTPAGVDSGNTLTYTWLYNNQPAPGLFQASTITNGAQGVFTPTTAQIGNQKVSALIDDGYDQVKCEWSVDVSGPCAIVASLPSGNSTKVAAKTGTTTPFGVTANQSTCTASWTLNGATVAGAAVLNVASSALTTGNNTLIATISDGSTSDSKTWTVIKNSPPSCSSSTLSTGNTVFAPNPFAVTVAGTDADNDPLTFGWTLNGVAASVPKLIAISSSTQSQATFTPALSDAGSNTLAATIDDGFDQATCSFNVNVQGGCAVSGSLPTGTSLRVAANPSTNSVFAVTPSNSSCTVTWSVNGAAVGATSNSLSLPSSQLNAGNNTLIATLSNGSTSTTRTWTVVKNTPPVCSAQSPLATGNVVAVGNPLAFSASGTDANSDPLTFTWQMNGAPAPGGQFAITPGAGSSQATFLPIAGQVGNNTVAAQISDGYDSASCTWNVNVIPVCSFVSTTPTSANVRVAAASSTQSAFAIQRNDSSCAITWSLNGAAETSVTNVDSVSSTSLQTGNNTLVATLTNAAGSITHTWNVVKNTPPTCSQNPGPTGGSVNVGGNILLSTVGTDANSDPLTYAWQLNGANVLTSEFAITSGGNNSQAVYSPVAGEIGPNSVAVHISDGYDTTTCQWALTVQNNCAVSSSLPAASSIKVPALGTTSTQFFVVPNLPSCTPVWSLNGVTLNGVTTLYTNVLSSQLSAGTNTLSAQLGNGTSTVTRTWNIVKNNPPVCQSQTPAASGNLLALPATMNLTANGSDLDSDPLTFSWKVNGSVEPPNYLSPFSSANSSLATFSPDTTFIGNNTVTASISDGFDTNSCSWAVAVQPSCSILSSAPGSANVRVANLGSTSNSFVVNPSDPSCNVTWTLNGAPLGSAGTSQAVLSSAFAGGANSLVATASNGSSSASKTWTIVKNTPPTCSSQTPAASGASAGVGQPFTLTASGADAESDPLTFTWTLNGQATNPAQFSVTPGSGFSQGIFTPSSSQVGTDTVVATIFDGYDKSTCSWSLNVLPSCTFTNTIPASANIRVSSVGSTSTSFSVTPSDTSCVLSWNLNGTTTGNTNSLSAILSSSLAPGVNSLSVTAANSVSTVTKTWTVNRNLPPTCSSQSPNSTGSSVNVGNTLNLTANGNDPAGLPLSFAWTVNGNATSASEFTITPGSTSSVAAYTPLAGSVGTNTIVANISDGYDSAVCSWQSTVLNNCSILSSAPAGSTLRVSASGTASTQFAISPNLSSCTPVWSLNGSPIAGATAPFTTIASSTLNSGANTLSVTISNGSTSATRAWTVSKNNAPTCGSQSPASTGSQVSLPNNIGLTANGSDADGDPLTFTWLVNGTAPTGSVLSAFNGVSSSLGTFTPTTALIGNDNVVASFTDGLDTNTCAWSVNVLPGCTIPSSTPSSGNVRIAANAASQNTFQITPSSGSCAISWTLNGSPVSGTSPTQILNSSAFSAGNNLLTATVSNGSSTSNKTWTVAKNNPPTCSAQTPAASGAVAGVGVNMNITATGTDAESDPLTFAWTINGSPVSAPNFTITTPSAGSSQAAFLPTSAQTGVAAITAAINDGYDTTNCNWNISVLPACSVTSSSPSTPTRVAAAGATTTSFGVQPNDSSCAVSWKLNGSALATGAIVNVLSSSLASGSNTLVATLNNGVTTATQTWTVNKNHPPVCSSQTPNANPNPAVGINNTLNLIASGTDADSDPLTFSWKIDGAVVNNTILNVTSPAAGQSQGAFRPDSTYSGTSNLVASITDGFDTTTCSWTVGIYPICAAQSSLPNTSTLRVAAANGTSTSFGLVPNDSSCAVSWALNSGAAGSAGTGNFTSVNSSSLTTGNNTLTASLTNQVGTVTRTWTIVKNTPPVCSSAVGATTPLQWTSTRALTANVSNPLSSPLTYTWMLNGAAVPSIFPSPTGFTTQSAVTFTPTSAQIGTAQTVTCSFTDGLDTGSCGWSFDITDPNTVRISSCQPATTSPVVVLSAGNASTQSLTSVATGTGLSFAWLKNASTVNGATSATYNVSASSYTWGNYTIENLVTDAYSNQANCTWNVKVNAPPVINSSFPTVNGSVFKVNYASTQVFSVNASNLDSDPLTYTWTYDGGINPSILPTGTSSTTYSPGSSLSELGSHTITVTVTDGYETVTKSWPIETNLFSTACDNIYNGTVATTGGHVCTLIGNPSIGNGNSPTADQTKVSISPVQILDDGGGNLFVTDQNYHVVWFYNTSASPITRFGMTIGAGKIVAIAGNGSSGYTADGTTNNNFKLYSPMGIAYDSANKLLYIADYSNHRVAVMDNTGAGKTIFGTVGNTTQNAGSNTDGAVGTTHVCGNPTGIDFVTYGGQKWLYVSCYSSNSIKRMNADPSSGSYGLGYTVVGRINAAGTALAGNIDGTLGPNGEAQANGPWALSDDGNGNIYWVDYLGFRARMATTNGNPVSLFGPSISAATQILATDMNVAGNLGTSANATIQAYAGTAASANYSVYGPASNVTGSCVAYKVVNIGGGQPSPVGANTNVTLSSSTGGSFYSNSTCTTPFAPANTAVISAGKADTIFYFSKGTTGATALTAATGGVAGSIGVNVQNNVAPAKIVVYPETNFYYTDCAQVTIQLQSAGGLAAQSTAARTVQVYGNGSGNFYSDSACATTPKTTFSFTTTQSEISVYYARTVNAGANATVSIAGYSTLGTYTQPNQVAFGNSSLVSSMGLATFRQPRGIAVQASAGVVSGVFVAQSDQERVLFMNNSPTTVTYGGTAIYGYAIDSVMGNGNCCFNGDGIVGVTAQANWIAGIALDPAQTKLYIADMNDNRLRKLDITTASGRITELVGAGFIRPMFTSDAAVAATAMTFNSPSEIVIDNTHRQMYISDVNNNRIRSMDMLTGFIQTIISRGSGPSNVDNDDPLNVYLRYPRGLALMNTAQNTFLIYADQQSNTAINSNCMIRAYNMSGPNATPFNVAVNANKIATLAGNFAKGCNTWSNASPNTDGMAGPSAQLYNPEGIATDGTYMYIANYNDHCILQQSVATGNITRLIGTCGPAPNPPADGLVTAATTRYPMQITMDIASGLTSNFFFVDSIDLNTGRVRYVNFSNQIVTIGGVSVPAANPTPQVATVLTYIPINGVQSRLNGVALFANQICYTAGDPGNGNNGGHNVTCIDRTNSLGAITLRVGPNEATSITRAGGPLGTEQEGVAGSAALVASPFGIAFDSAGNLYFSERLNSLVRMVGRWF